jgi:tripartite-type tricarboxylate transporter receptor subunit TctC
MRKASGCSRRAALAAAVVAVAGWPVIVQSAEPLRIIVPWPTGGAADSLARLLALHLQEAGGRSVVVDNRGGANGIIGAEALARSTPDGNTVMFHSITSHATNAVLQAKLPYDTFDDFKPVTQVTSMPLVIVVHPDVPAKTVQELVEAAKRRPGSLSYASIGNGSMPHIAGELLNLRAGIDMRHVPYKGGGPALQDTLAGHVPVYFSGITVSLPHIRSGKLRALAVTGSARAPQLPDVPAVAETPGLGGYEASITYGVWAPAKAPAQTIEQLRTLVSKAVARREFQERLVSAGALPAQVGSAEQMTATLRSDVEALRKIAATAGLTLQ